MLQNKMWKCGFIFKCDKREEQNILYFIVNSIKNAEMIGLLDFGIDIKSVTLTSF